MSKSPASALLSDETNSVGLSVTSMPTFASIAWMTCPRRAATGSVAIVKDTLIGVGMPEALTNFCAERNVRVQVAGQALSW